MTSEHAEGQASDDEEELFHLRSTELAFHRQRLRFDLARSVFASGGIDPGSALLLRHLQTVPLEHVKRVLDVGSGVGVLGIVLCALDRGRRLTAVDRDALACAYTRRNLALNALTPGPGSGHQVLGSLGYDDLFGPDRPDPAPYELIVSNLPGKAGERVIVDLVAGAAGLAADGAVVGFVVVRPLAELVTRAVRSSGYEILVTKGNKTHHVVVARIDGPRLDPGRSSGGFEAGVYDRQTSEFSHRSLRWQATTVTGLPEFDSLSHPTTMLRAALQGVAAGPSLVVNPGQGHRAIIAARAGYPPSTVSGRDLLALRATSRCLVDNGVAAPSTVHSITVGAALEPDTSLVIVHADDKIYAPFFVDQVTRVLDHLASTTADRSRDLVLTGRAGLLGRLEADVLRRRPGRLAHKASQRGFRALRFRVSG